MDDPPQAKRFLSPPLINMADQRPPQTVKESNWKGFRNLLKKLFGLGSDENRRVRLLPARIRLQLILADLLVSYLAIVPTNIQVVVLIPRDIGVVEQETWRVLHPQ